MAAVDALGLVGTTVAKKYAIEDVVGDGGFSIVYRATHLIWKRPVAIKVFKALGELSADERDRLLQAFIQEGALLADLSARSAAICQARDVGTLTTEGGEWLPYMVLEWLEGLPLDVVLYDERQLGMKPRSLEDAVRLLGPAVKALALAHRSGIAHRDVKPANLFVLGDPRSDTCAIKVLDFGIAKVVGEAQKVSGAFSKTSGAFTSFTPAYGSPEQFSRRYGSTGPWTDVYAMALILVEMISGKDALASDDVVVLGDLSCDPNRRPTPRTLGAALDDDAEAVFEKALAVNPADRYQTADEFWNGLRAALDMPPMSRLTDPRAKTIPHAPTSSSGGGRDTETLSAPILPYDVHPGKNPNTIQSAATASSRPPVTPSSRSRSTSLIAMGVVAVGLLGAGGFYAKNHLSGSVRDATPAPAATHAPIVVAPPPEPTCPTGMLKIPGGKFFMGSDDGLPLEKPAHKVSVSPFCVDEFEVSTALYKKCSDEGECKRGGMTNDWSGITDHDKKAFDPLCNLRDPDTRGTHPVNCVDWEMASIFCHSYAKRLPTEAEWEFAARGPDGRKYPWGDEPPSAKYLNACGKECLAWGQKNQVEETAMYPADDHWPNTAPVGSFPDGKSRYGVQDVVGNVWEWVADWYAPYDSAEQIDPEGPSEGENRGIRGGAWNGGYDSWVRPTFRYRDNPNKRSYGIGFRCAKSLEGATPPPASTDAPVLPPKPGPSGNPAK